MRYWDGERWTTWVADDTDAFDEDAPAIVIRRNRAYAGRLMRSRVLIDGDVAGYLRPGESQVFPVSDGAHRVRIKQFPTASRELDVVVPPNAEMSTGPRGGSWAAFFIGIVQPHRCLELDQESDREHLSRWLVAAGVLAYIALIVAIAVVMPMLLHHVQTTAH